MQWFGDTATFAFWGDLWLAEGPATYFEVGLYKLLLLCVAS
jgi:aminopeptidase N